MARLADASRGAVSRLERGHLDEITMRVIRRIAEALEINLTIVARWRSGELDRMLNAGHAAMHEALARFLRGLPGWVFAPEVSYAIYGERGVIDILCWHPETRTLLIVELKTAVIDVQDLMARADIRRRLARRIARDRGWEARSVSVWVVMAEGKTNRRRVQAHAATLRAAFPLDGRSMRHWLQKPQGEVAALSFWSIARGNGTKGDLPTRQRVRRSGAS